MKIKISRRKEMRAPVEKNKKDTKLKINERVAF